MRNKLVDIIAAKNIKDKRVLDAIRAVPRHLFMDSSFEDHAYQDKAFPIAAEQKWLSDRCSFAIESQGIHH